MHKSKITANRWKFRYYSLKASTQRANKPTNNPAEKLFNPDQLKLLAGEVVKVQKWTDPTLMECLQLRFTCKGGYDKLRAKGYPFPAYRTLMRYIEDVKFESGPLDDMFPLMGCKVETMDEEEKDCGMVVDEVSLDQSRDLCSRTKRYIGTVTLPPSDTLATKGIVFMLVGIKSRWKQVVGFAYTGNSIPKGALKEMTFKLIENAENVGLRVQFVTSDYGSENLRMWKDAGVDFSRRNVLMNTSIPHPQDPEPTAGSFLIRFAFSKNVVNWLDQQQIPNRFPTVGAALHMIAEKEGKPELHTTACFVEDISKWFSIINNRNEDCALNSGDEDNTIANISHLNDNVRLVYDLTVGDSGAWKPWKTGLAMCTNAIIRLIDLLLQNGHTQILTSRFTQDCLESLFSLIRYSQKRPTPLQFTQNLRIITLSQFMSPVPNASYSFDDQSHLIGMADIISSRKKNKVAKPAVEQREGGPDSTNAAEKSLSAECMVVHGKLCEKEEDLVEFNYQGFLAETGSYHDRAEKNVIYFMAGYVLRKMSFRPTTCRTCLKGCKSTDPESIQESLFTRLRSRQTRNKNAFFVSRDVFDFFIALDVFVRNGYSAFGNESDIQNKIEREAEVLPNIFHCGKFKKTLVGRFIRLRLKTYHPRKSRKMKFDSRSMYV
ncbi:hypothetical protein quinque_005828 [Culex quinquefasciatus]